MVTISEKNRIFVSLNGAFKDEEQCRVAMETIVDNAHAAYGVNSHFWFQSDDGKSLFVLEQYEDRKALSQAIRRFTRARMSFFGSIKDYRIALYGNASLGSKMMFAAFRPQIMNYYGGYSKAVAKTEKLGIKDFERKRVIVATSAKVRDEEKCRVSMEAVVKNSYSESGTKTHFWSKSRDGNSLIILEQYEDENALLEHVRANQQSKADLLESSKVTSVTIYGAKSDQTKDAFATLNPKYMNYFGGYLK